MPTVKLILQRPYEGRKKNGDKIPATKETRLYAFLIVDQARVVKCKTEYTILPTEWDFDTQAKDDSIAGAIEFNLKLAKIKADLLKHYDELREQYPDATFQEIASKLKEWSKLKDKPVFSDMSFFEVLDEYKKSLKGKVTYRTIQKFTTLERSLKDFGADDDYKKYKLLTFSQIDLAFYDDYIAYLRKQPARGRQKRRPDEKQKGLLIDTQRKYIENLKAFCKWAKEHPAGFNKYSDFEKFKVVSDADKKRIADKKNIVTLTLPELQKFYNHEFSNKSLARVRDLFCFAVFTGQRWSDIEQFEKKQLKGDIWTFTAQKTLKKTEIDMCGFAAPALKILKDYNYELPIISLQKFNSMLKDAGREAGIDAPVELVRFVGVDKIITAEPKWYFMASHMARRTHVSLMLNVFNVAPSLVMAITQHTDLKTLQKYLDEDRGARREAMSKTPAINETMVVTHKKEAI